MTDHPLRLRVEVKVAPERPLELRFLDPQLGREDLSEFGDAESPAPESAGENDVSLPRGKVDVLVVLLLKVTGRLVVVHERVRLLRDGVLPSREPTLALLAPTEVIVHALAGKETAHDRVRLLDELREVMIGLQRRLLELRHETVQLVDDENGTQAVGPRLA